MTVYELIEELKKHPPMDEVKLGFGVTSIPMVNVRHEMTYDQHYVVVE